MIKAITKHKGWQLVAAQFGLFFLLMISTGLEYISMKRTEIMIVVYIGLIFFMIGIIGLIISVLHYRQRISPFPLPGKDIEFRHTGIYSAIRHPMYSSLILSSLGFILFFNSFFTIIIWVGIVLLFRYKAKVEEMYLLEKYSTYEEYLKRTNRFIPRLNKNN